MRGVRVGRRARSRPNLAKFQKGAPALCATTHALNVCRLSQPNTCLRFLQLFLVGFCVLINPGSTMQLITGFAFALVMTLFVSMAEPFERRGHGKFSLLCNFSLLMVFFFCLVLKMGVLSEDVEDSNLLSEELRALSLIHI